MNEPLALPGRVKGARGDGARSTRGGGAAIPPIKMITMTLNKAKAKLHQLVEAAESGEQVVLMRGSEIVATLVPLHSKDLQINSSLTDQQAKQFWEGIEEESSKTFLSPAKTIAFLRKQHS